MKRLERLKVLGKWFRIVYSPPGSIELADYGHMNLTRLEIALQDSLPLSLEQDTLLHEVIHAVEKQLGLDLTETQVNMLGCGLTQVMLDNECFVRYFLPAGQSANRVEKRLGQATASNRK